MKQTPANSIDHHQRCGDPLVKRVAQAICDADTGMLTEYETLARAALEASGHAELVEALELLQWATDHYANPDMSHIDYRVHVAVAANRILATLKAEGTGAIAFGLPKGGKTQPDCALSEKPKQISDCAHNFIRITKSSYRAPPYLFCSKCGQEREVTNPLTESDLVGGFDPPLPERMAHCTEDLRGCAAGRIGFETGDPSIRLCPEDYLTGAADLIEELWAKFQREKRAGLALAEMLASARALAAAAREGGDVKQAPAESPQSGGEAVTPNLNRPSQRSE